MNKYVFNRNVDTGAMSHIDGMWRNLGDFCGLGSIAEIKEYSEEKDKNLTALSWKA